MKISVWTIIAIVSLQGLIGCETLNAADKDTCGRRSLAKYVGTPFDDFIVKGQFQGDHTRRDDGSGLWDFDDRTYLLEVFDPRAVLQGEDQIVLANYSPSRLRIFVGKDGQIEKLTCG